MNVAGLMASARSVGIFPRSMAGELPPDAQTKRWKERGNYGPPALAMLRATLEMIQPAAGRAALYARRRAFGRVLFDVFYLLTS